MHINFNMSLTTQVTSSAPEITEKLSYFSQGKGNTTGKVFER